MTTAIGIDIGGTNLRLGVFDGLTLIDEARFQADFSKLCHEHAPQVAWQKIIEIIANAIEKVQTKHPAAQAIGIGFPGFIHPHTQVIAQSPNLPGLKDVNLLADLSQKMGNNTKKIIIENDANAAAYGEYCLLNKPSAGLIYLGLGTGVGGGLVLNGKLYSGQHGCAMEVGHIMISPQLNEPEARQCGCGNRGCMEQYASASGVVKSYMNATGQTLTAQQIAALADNGDSAAINAYRIAANALAQALASILKVVDVEHVVIGGGLIGAWSLMQADFDRRLTADLIPVLRGKIQVNCSSANDTAGMLGAAMLASVK